MKISRIVLYIFLIYVAVQIIQMIYIPALIIAGSIVAYKMLKRRSKKRKVITIKEPQKAAKIPFVSKYDKDSVEFKMERILQLADYPVTDRNKRFAYQTAHKLDLLDQWYKFIDLRAKLQLNNTDTNREEAVLHLMCDEVLNRIDSVEVEVADHIKREFIQTHVGPLLQDLIDIMEGTKPLNTISIDAYQLLRKEKEPVYVK